MVEKRDGPPRTVHIKIFYNFILLTKSSWQDWPKQVLYATQTIQG